MRHLAAVLVLVLASTDASKYFRPETQLQREPPWREKYQEVPYLAIAFDDDRLLPKLAAGEEGGRWESPQDPRLLLLGDLDSLENLLQDEANESRIKRTKTSLSIDNPLDVLRQQYFRALARRMKYKSIEKNREHLLQTGKRSGKDVQFLQSPGKRSAFSSKVSRKDFPENGGSGESGARRYQGRLDDLSYQT